MPFKLPARMVTAVGVIEGETENLSLHGAFIRCQKPLELGERLFVIVKLPSNPPIRSHAEVVWLRMPLPEDEETSLGTGVKFIN
jgi:Tfp pilus assembly protein PilZ